jgi:(R,R)-butanediol dehydrogenase / meso-butanediol dehydrogenase / diacetyl reductase
VKALVYHARNDIRLEDFPEAVSLAGDEVRLKVKRAGICHTDYNEYRHGPLYVAASPHPRTGRSVPIVIGHEFSGEVVEAGAAVRRLKLGDRVAVNAVDSCRNCFYCRSGHEALCASAAYVGFSRDGGFAQSAVVPEACCHRLGDGVSFEAGALVEPLAVAVHAVRQAGVGIGCRAAIVGGGTVGLCTLQALRVAGARDVFVVEKSEAKRKFSEALGASAFINADQTDPVEAIRELTDGLGADVAFECVGTAGSMATAATVTRGAGTTCIVGVFPGDFEFDFNTFLSREKSIATSLAYSDEFPTVIKMLGDGRLKAEPLITRMIPLAQSLDQGLKQYETLAATNVRMLINMDA